MKSAIFVILLLIGWVYAASVREPCPPNESYTGCDIPCSALSKPYQVICRSTINDKCMCKDGFFRTKEGTCVSMEQCPEKQCPPGSSWNRCVRSCAMGPACDGTPCGFRYYGAMCLAGCKCDEGLMVHPDGRCVKAEECPPLPTCPTNKTYNPCWGCTEEECGDFPVMCAYGCVRKGCKCQYGFLRNGEGQCVKKEDCPKVKCGPNEVYKTCGSKCSEPKCKSAPGQPEICPAVCEQGCFCHEDFARNEAGECVYDHTPSCPGGA